MRHSDGMHRQARAFARGHMLGQEPNFLHGFACGVGIAFIQVVLLEMTTAAAPQTNPPPPVRGRTFHVTGFCEFGAAKESTGHGP